jgi:hypothetical protein
VQCLEDQCGRRLLRRLSLRVFYPASAIIPIAADPAGHHTVVTFDRVGNVATGKSGSM